MFYAIHATYIEKTEDGSITRQVPTFFLDGWIQGITTTEAAEKVARRVVDPTGKAEVHVTAFEHPDVTVDGREA